MRQPWDLDQRRDRLTAAAVAALATGGVAVVGGVDYVTGYEVSLSFFYLGPVAIATWYAGRVAGIGIALLSCAIWYLAEVAAGNQYSHPAILVWNALVRLGFFLITSLLLSALRQSLFRQRHLARMDGLTELYGRRAFEERLRHDLALARRRRSTLSLAYLDLDDFKRVNDVAGHGAGDRVLQAVARVLQDTVREVDTPARVGGDEFVLVLPDTDRRGAERVIAKISGGLRAAVGASPWPVTCSIGVVTFVAPAISSEDALAAADALMYDVKRKGKGGVAYDVLEPSVHERAAPDAESA